MDRRKKLPAVVHTRIDAARRRTLARSVVSSQLGALLGDAAAAAALASSAPALPWVDLEVAPAFDAEVEICVDCPEKRTGAAGAFSVARPRHSLF